MALFFNRQYVCCVYEKRYRFMYLLDSSDCYVYIYILCVCISVQWKFNLSCYPATGILFSDQTMGSLWHSSQLVPTSCLVWLGAWAPGRDDHDPGRNAHAAHPCKVWKNGDIFHKLPKKKQLKKNVGNTVHGYLFSVGGSVAEKKVGHVKIEGNKITILLASWVEDTPKISAVLFLAFITS